MPEKIETLTWTFQINKDAWGVGSWRDEADKKQWTDPATGLPCLIVRNPYAGHFCGYVGVDNTHPYFGVEDSWSFEVSVHGGITYTDFCAENADITGHSICHLAPNEEKVWWLGFDHGHSSDYSPGMGRYGLGRASDYTHLDEMEKECTDLAKQIFDNREKPLPTKPWWMTDDDE